MAEPSIRRPTSALDEPLARLGAGREQLAKDWLLRLIERTPLEEIERLPTDRLARALPDLIGGVLAALGKPDDRTSLESGGEAHDSALELAALRADDGLRALPADIASLQSVLLAALREQLGEKDTQAFLDAVERLTAVTGALQAAALGELMRGGARGGAWLPARDRLTGLPDFRFLQERVSELAAIQRRYGHPFALLLIDIDGLGRINTACGERAGDAVLRALAGSVGEMSRDADILARTGGDEFCVLAPQQTATRASTLGARLAAAAEELEPAGRVAVRVAIGIAGFPEHTAEHEQLFELADEAMFRARAANEPWALAMPPG